jgi:hypothetical protein
MLRNGTIITGGGTGGTNELPYRKASAEYELPKDLYLEQWVVPKRTIVTLKVRMGFPSGWLLGQKRPNANLQVLILPKKEGLINPDPLNKISGRDHESRSLLREGRF